MRRLIKIWSGLLLLLFGGCPAGWAQTTLPDSAAGWYQVQPGDTYYRLAKIYGVPVDSLRAWNGDHLPAGKTIRVRATRSATLPQIQATAANSPAGPTQQPTAAVSNQVDASPNPAAETAAPRVVIVPFDPYLYFSDADHDIARQSRVPVPNVRYIFRARLSALLDPLGLEPVSLLSAGRRDSVDELRKVYQSLAYSYQPITPSRFNPLAAKLKTPPAGPQAWWQRQKEKLGVTPPGTANPAAAGDKYYGVKVKNLDFYPYFNSRYQADYYLFINQFEIRTDYTNCIDRVTQNFVREFVVHYTIFNAQGKLLAGNQVKIPYVSNVNDVDKIVRDNLGKMAQRILADLPGPQSFTSEAAQK